MSNNYIYIRLEYRLDNFLVPMQCTGNLGCFPWGNRAAIVWRYPALFFPVCSVFCVSIPPAVRPTLLRQMDMRSLTCAQIWVHAVHMKGVRHKQVCTRVHSERQKKCSWRTLSRQGIEPRVFGFEFRCTILSHVLHLNDNNLFHFIWFMHPDDISHCGNDV